MNLRLIWAAPAAATAYRPERLTTAEQQRAQRRRSPRAAEEWAVSRALLQAEGVAADAAPGPGWSLSHSQRHALLLRGPATLPCGVDLEQRRPRPVERLAEWICDADEQRWLTTLAEPERLAGFYRLWTLKEALVKAAGLAFPAGMKRATLQQSNGAATLQVDAPGPWAVAVFEWQGWTAAAAWRGSATLPLIWQAGPASHPPTPRCVLRVATTDPRGPCYSRLGAASGWQAR